MMTVPLVNLVDPPSRAEAAKLEVAAWEERMAAEAAAKAAAAATKAAAAARKAGVEAGAPLTAGGGGGEDGEGGGGTSTGVSVAPTAIVLSTGASTRVMRANSFRGTGADDISAPGSVSGASLQRSDSLRHRNLLAADGAEGPAVAGLASNAPVTTIVVPPSASSGAMSAGSGGRSGGVGGGEEGGGGGGGVLSDLRHSVSTRLRSGSMAVAHTLVAIVGGGRGRGGEDGEPTDAVMVEMPGDGSAAGSSDGPGPLASPAQRPPIIRRASSGFDAHASAPASPLARRASVEGTGFGGTGGSLAASAAAAAAAAAHGAHALAHLPLKVVLAIGETSAAQSLVSITNALADCDPLSATNATRPLSLTLTWLLESIDMPSSYMNFTDCVDDIRDTNLAAALGRCEQRNRLDIAAFPTHQPFHDACDEARQKHAHFLLCSMRFLRDSAGILPGNEDLGKLLAVAAVEARPCTTLLLFDFSKLFHVMRVLVPLTPDPHCADQALDFVQSLDSAVEVTMLHTVATPPEDADPAPVHAAAAAAAAAVAAGTGSATYASPPPRSGTLPRKQAGDSEVVGDDGATTAATTAVVALPVTVATTPAAGFMPPITPAAGGAAVGGVASPAAPTYAHSRLTRAFLPPDAAGAGVAEEGAPSASSLPPPPPPRRPVVDARRHAGGALPTVIEVPTVNSFSAMLAAATSADLEKFRAAVEAARLEREGGGAGAGAAGSGDGGAAGRGAAARGAGARPAAESRIAEEEHEGGSAEGEVEHDGSRRVSFADDMDAAAAGGSFSAGSPAYHRGRGTAGSTAGGAGSSVSAGGRFVPAAGGAGGEIEVSAGTDAILADRLRYMLSTRAACREVAASGGADIATATDFVLRHAPRPYDLVVVGADSTDFMRPGVSEAAAQNALLARLLPFLTVCRANHTSVMVVVSRSHHHHHHRASASGGGGGSGSAAAH